MTHFRKAAYLKKKIAKYFINIIDKDSKAKHPVYYYV